MSLSGAQVPPVVGSAGPSDLNLLPTKLTPPRLPPSFVPRAGVNALLDVGTAGPLTLVSAGAGWGKTLSAASWVHSEPGVGPVAWVTLDPADNDPSSFWSCVVGALRTLPDMGDDNPLLRLDPGLGPEEQTLRRLLRGVQQLDRPVVLVLDDFQVITRSEVLESLSRLLLLPAQGLRVVMLTRLDPYLPLHRIRIAGDLVEVRAADLALNASEARRLLAADGVSVSSHDVSLLLDRTEGWPAGVRLAALFLSRDEPGHVPAEFGGQDHSVVEYLAEEVLAQHTPEVQQFLLRTSLVDRVSPALAQALSAHPGGEVVLEELAATNSFVVAVGTGPARLFRYHTLLREVLRHRLRAQAPEQIPELHRVAATWYAAHDEPLEALRHTAEAKDWGLLGRLLADQCLPLALSGERSALDAVLARVPPQRIADSPELALAAAVRHFLAGDLLRMDPHLRRARHQTRRAPAVAGTHVALLITSLAVGRARGDNDRLIQVSRRALKELDGPAVDLPAATEYRVIALANLGTAELWVGDLRSARLHLSQGLAEDGRYKLDATRVNMLAHQALAAAVAGDQLEAASRAKQALRIVDERGWSPLIQATTAHLAEALVHFHREDLTSSALALAQAHDASGMDRSAAHAARLFQVHLDTANGELRAARHRLQGLLQTQESWRAPLLLQRWARLVGAELDLAGGDPQGAVRRLALSPEADPSTQIPERLLQARALLAGDWRGADAALAPIRGLVPPGRLTVEAEVLDALVADRARDDQRAMGALRRALAEAASTGVRRPFLAWAPEPMARLLRRAHLLHPSARALVDALELSDQGPPPHHGSPQEAPELTDRERNILEYLPTLLTIPEIAAELFVSNNTVKSHLRHLYLKLDVTSRRQAVARARELGLLQP